MKSNFRRIVVRPRPPRCLLGDDAASTFYSLVCGEKGSRNYTFAKANEHGYFFEPLINRYIVFDNRMLSMWVEVVETSEEAEELLIDGNELCAA